MKKTLLFTVMALLSAIAANAQIRLGVSLNAGMPAGDFSNWSGFGPGVSVNAKYMVSETLGAGLQVGYLHFGEKDNSGIKTNIVPITTTWAYYFTKQGLRPYLGTDAGLYHLKTKASYSDEDEDGEDIAGSVSASATKFGVAPTLGVEYGLSEKVFFDGNVKYNTISTEGNSTSFWGINIGLSFKL